MRGQQEERTSETAKERKKERERQIERKKNRQIERGEKKGKKTKRECFAEREKEKVYVCKRVLQFMRDRVILLLSLFLSLFLALVLSYTRTLYSFAFCNSLSLFD